MFTLNNSSQIYRCGFRGTAVHGYLQQAGFIVPEKPNTAILQSSRELILRLSEKEFFLLGAEKDQGKRLEELEENLNGLDECYNLYRCDSHIWFIMTGERRAEDMAHVCGVDLRDSVFPVGSIAQTSVARVNAIIMAGEDKFHILADRASADYLWDSLQDISSA